MISYCLDKAVFFLLDKPRRVFMHVCEYVKKIRFKFFALGVLFCMYSTCALSSNNFVKNLNFSGFEKLNRSTHKSQMTMFGSTSKRDLCDVKTGRSYVHVSPIKIAASGFPEFLPEAQIIFDRTKHIISVVFSKYGYSPVETPAIERIKTITAKGINNKEIYGLRRLNVSEGDEGEKDLALRFDHTIPLARYVAKHSREITFPFRRQAIGKVWRGERASSGRYREFYQCDVDIIGRGNLDIIHDAEPPAIINEIFDQMKIGEFVIRVNNRKILQGLFEGMGLRDYESIKRAIKTVDSMEKVTVNESLLALKALGLTADNAKLLIDLLTTEEENSVLLDKLSSMELRGESFQKGVREISTVYRETINLGVPERRLKIDLGIARGLDYYTGTVYETGLIGYPDLGSICSGGRYDNLAELYGEEPFPGVGISIGLTRLFSNLLERGLVICSSSSVASVLVTSQDKRFMSSYQRIATMLRSSNINTEIYYENDSLGKQLKFASKKGIRFATISNGDEVRSETVNVKDLISGQQARVPWADLIRYITEKSKESW